MPRTSGELDLLAAFTEYPQRVLSRDLLLDRTKGRIAGPYDLRPGIPEAMRDRVFNEIGDDDVGGQPFVDKDINESIRPGISE